MNTGTKEEEQKKKKNRHFSFMITGGKKKKKKKFTSNLNSESDMNEDKAPTVAKNEGKAPMDGVSRIDTSDDLSWLNSSSSNKKAAAADDDVEK